MLEKLQGDDARPACRRLRARLAREGQAPAARRARQALCVRIAGGAGRPGVRVRSGRRSSASRRRRGAASPTRTRPKRPRAPNIAGSPSAACGSGSCSPKSAPRAEVKVTDEEMTQRADRTRARLSRARRKQVWDYYRNNNQALAELRAPIYEEKVVDHILGLAKVEDRKVTRGGTAEAGRGRSAGEPLLAPRRAPEGSAIGPALSAGPLFGALPGAYVDVRRQSTRLDFPRKQDPCAIRSTITTTISCRS